MVDKCVWKKGGRKERWGRCICLIFSHPTQVVMETLNIFAMGAQFERAYKMAESVKHKLELSFSTDANRWITGLDWAIKRYVRA